jgi:hypothetical protein
MKLNYQTTQYQMMKLKKIMRKRNLSQLGLTHWPHDHGHRIKITL